MDKKEKIKARLRVLFPKANLSTKRMDEISAKLEKKIADDADDAAFDLVLNDANDLMDFVAIAKEDDRIRTLEANQKQKNDPPTDPPADPPKPPTPPADDTPAWAKSIIEQNQKLADELNQIKSGKIIESKRAAAQKAFESSQVLKGLDENLRQSWANRIDVNSETPIDDQVKGLEAELTALQQTIVQSQRFSGPAPTGGPVNGPSKQEVEAIVDTMIS